MDYIIENSKEIMMLCFGTGFLILVLVLSRFLWLTTRLVKKVDDLSDLVIHYVNKPISALISGEKMIMGFLDKISKK